MMNSTDEKNPHRANNLKANPFDSKWVKPELKLLNGDQVDGKTTYFGGRAPQPDRAGRRTPE